MSAAYKIALAAGASLLLIVIASLILQSDNDPADVAIAPAPESGTPPADPPGLDEPPLDTPPGPPPLDHNRIAFADEPVLELPLRDDADPVPSLSVGRSPFPDDDPLFGSARDPFGTSATANTPLDLLDLLDTPEDPDTPDTPEATAPPTLVADAAPAPEPIPTVQPRPLSPVDPVSSNVPGADRRPIAPPPGPPLLRLYTVESGDNLSSIALATYGDDTKWVDIAQANPLVDPNRLRVGQELKLPDLTPASGNTSGSQGPNPAADAAASGNAEENSGGSELPRRGTTYIVKSGDTLSSIAQQFYNAAAKWQLIYQANRRTIGDNPGNINVGDELLIPPPDTGAR
ncbi:MAG: LysM peptidoglycan-binding domain-containing protein [Planctomycetota bacterium]